VLALLVQHIKKAFGFGIVVADNSVRKGKLLALPIAFLVAKQRKEAFGIVVGMLGASKKETIGVFVVKHCPHHLHWHWH